jgi:hypothetical protein
MLIYKVTNIQSKKIYIGLTINRLEDRRKSHEYRAFLKTRKRREKFQDLVKKTK